MRVLLVNCPNRLSRRPEFFPYGLGILARILTKHGFYVEIYDLNLRRDLDDFAQFISDKPRWDAVGVSGLVTTYGFQKRIASLIRLKLPDSLIISGGGLATAVPELLVSRSDFDVACIGEGEEILAKLLIAWQERADISAIRGIVWQDKASRRVVRNKLALPIKDLDQIPFPDWEKAGLDSYFVYSGFFNKGVRGSRLRKRADLTTTRGCPYDCSFCFNVYSRGFIRYRSIDNVIEEIRLLKDRYNVDSIDFLDENFCFSHRRVQELCHRLLEADFGIEWGTAARVTDVDPDLLKLMRKAGCIFILYGFETGSQTILDKMDKRITIEQAWEAFIRTEEAGIDARGNLIIGHPGENLITLAESLHFQMKRYEFLKTLHADRLESPEFQEDMQKRFSTVSFCTPYPGTRIYKENLEKIGDLESFMERITLHDARDFVVNLSDVSDSQLLAHQCLLASPERWCALKA